MSTATVEAATIQTTGGTRVARIVLIVVGGLGTLFGLYILLSTVRPQGLLGLGVWLFGALLLHDGILSPTLFLAQRVLHRVGRRISGRTLALVQGGVLVGGILTLVVLPEIIARAKGPRNASVLNMDYGLHLFVAWIVITVVTVIAVTGAHVWSRRHQVVTAAATPPQAPVRGHQGGLIAWVAVLLLLPVALLLRRFTAGRR